MTFYNRVNFRIYSTICI